MPGAGAAPFSPALWPRGRRGSGVPGAPGRPASIAAPRALIGLGAATTREASPAAHPPRPAGPGRAEGGGPAPSGPVSDRAWRTANATPPPPGGRAVSGFTEPPVQCGGRAGGERRIAPRGVGLPSPG